jgi:hypothetical protein
MVRNQKHMPEDKDIAVGGDVREDAIYFRAKTMRQKEQFLEGLINKLGPEHLSC